MQIIHIGKPNKIRGGEFLNVLGVKYINNTEGIRLEGDLLWAMYDPSDTNNKGGLPNKYFTAIINKIPIMVSEGSYLAERVRREKTGFVIEYSESAIKLFLENYQRMKLGFKWPDRYLENKKRFQEIFNAK